VPDRIFGLTSDATAPLNELEYELDSLYSAHAAGLLRYAFTLANDNGTAQDAIQEIFLRYFVARSEGRQFADPKSWLFRVLRNHLLDALKSSCVKSEVAIDGIENSPDRGHDPEERYHQTELAREITKLLAPRELECFRLRAEGLSYDEIAGIMDLRQGTVGAMLARAHQKMRRIFREAPEPRNRIAPRAMPREENSYSS